MAKGKIAHKQPAEVQLLAGKNYAWCACGVSGNQPFCDGSHKGSEFSPKMIKAEKDETVWLCQCKQSSDAPYCDGTHNTL